MNGHAHADHAASGPPWIILVLLAAGLACYLVAATRMRRRGHRWSGWASASFVAGTSLLAFSFALPWLSGHAASFPVHMAQHVLIAMLAPLALMLGTPLTLLLATVARPARRRLTATMHSRPVHLVAHPATAAILDTGGMYVLYLTPLYAATLSNAWLHHAIHLHFIAAGCLFAWSVAGRDPGPWRPPFRTRLVALLAVIAAHGALAKLMYAHAWPGGTAYSREELQAGAQVMYYGGTVAELLLAVALFTMWYEARGRAQARALRTRTAAA